MLIELQSTVDHLMPFRLLLYKTEIWRDAIKNVEESEVRRKDFKLPAIVPIVLYNGEGAWTANRRFRHMLAGEQLFGDELLDFEYLLLDVQRYTEQELMELSNVIGSVFLLEKKVEVERFSAYFRQVLQMMQKAPADMQHRFLHWMLNIILPKLPRESREQLEEVLDEVKDQEVSEVISQFAKTLDAIEEKRIKAGLEAGMEKGIKAGKIEVARNLLSAGMDI